MLGSESLIQSLVDSGVDVCFMNPGTSEMHFVNALDAVPQMRGVLTLFEGVATGAADGYARIAGRPAAVLLHLGPGLGNGLANLHNARRGHTPMVVVVGGHATYHVRYDAPLQSDAEALARTVSGWVRTSGHQRDVGRDAAQAVAAARATPGVIATLMLPADVSWSEGGVVAPPREPSPAQSVGKDVIDRAAEVLTDGSPAVLLIGGAALRERGQLAAARIGKATGARVIAASAARIERGAGLPSFSRLAYLAEHAAAQLAGTRHLVLAGAKSPVSFFAYPGMPSDLTPEGCEVSVLADDAYDVVAALEALAEQVAPGVEPDVTAAEVPAAPSGELTARSMAEAIAATLPPNAILIEEAITSGGFLGPALSGAPRHDVLTLTGGSIGQGLPTAVGAAVAAPDRPVLSIQADGSAMYTIQALWTQARENLNIVTVLINNQSYAILRNELTRVGAGYNPGPRALEMLDLGSPTLNFAELAQGMGVPGVRVRTAEELTDALRDAHASGGPRLVEAMLPAPQ
jgi:acetolactate synthase-1/2/3 large subunit